MAEEGDVVVETVNPEEDDDDGVDVDEEEEGNNNIANDNDSEEEEEECRVCRGPEEPGRPLFSPCKCSGSIGLVHQDCLQSWLAVTRGEGRCELCKVKFHFAPQYAENAPDRLSVPEVLLGLARRAVARWLPFLLRLAFCISLWLIVAPLLTSYLYLIWMNRSISCIFERWNWKLLPADTVSGAVLAAIILISFLSLMSFADFLRVEWQQQQQQQNNDNNNNNNPVEPAADAGRRLRRELVDAAEDNRRRLHEVDNGLVLRFNQERAQREEAQNADEQKEEVGVGGQAKESSATPTPAADGSNANGDNNAQQNNNPTGQEQGNNNDVVRNQQNNMNMENAENQNQNNNNNDVVAPILPPFPPLAADQAPPAVQRPNDVPPPPPPLARGDQPPPPPPVVPRPQPRPDRQFDANMNMDPLLQDDQVDMEINVALDELLGLRGPLSSLLRNLLWLLVFNTVYLGFFAFIPRTIGSAVFSNLLNTTMFDKLIDNLPIVSVAGTGIMVDSGTNITDTAQVEDDVLSLKTAVTQINEESDTLQTVFRLPDFAAVNLGYLFCATLVIMVRFGWIVIMKCRGGGGGGGNAAAQNDNNNANANNNNNNNERQQAGGAAAPVGEGRGGVDPPANNEAAAMAGGDQEGHAARLAAADGMEHPGFALGEAVTLILDATVAIVKVGILLFLKMFLLPVLLGIWLDGSSMELFGSNAQERIVYAGRDLFSFILLHWVAGITFMLLVTVSVLQLREVAHASLLAHLIRPQEPQPDLLGNLMHDSVVTQTKRMLLSLGIYTALLHLHVSIPVKLLMASGISDILPFLKLKFWHLAMPQLQVPVELLVFHLSMLALLEKYKNSIGELQHHWLVFMCARFGLANFILPHEVGKFSLVGHIPVFSGDLEVNPVLVDLVNETGEAGWEDLILSNVEKADGASDDIVGETRDSGERVLKSNEAYISLPSPSSMRNEGDTTRDTILLTTTKGRFRLKRREDPSADAAIEVWEEVPGKPIPRPPEGWDDLGAGGADIQGRWAWGKEKQSAIEKGVARRQRFFGPHGQSGMKLASLLARVALLLFFSWCATTLLLVFVISAPLGLGRLLYMILRVPEKYIHYPLGFALGSAIAFPAMALASSVFVATRETSLVQSLSEWLGAFRAPPARKATVLLATLFCWVVVCPLTLGLIYEVCLIKAPTWFSGEEDLVKTTDLAWSWVTGTVLLNTWACLCSLSVFTRDFWVNVGNGMLEVEGDNRRDRQENADAQDEAEEDAGPTWQGKDGRMARFFAALKAIFSNWEWETVDHVVLLVECAIPVSKNLGTLLLAPSMCYVVWFWFMDTLMALGEMAGSHRLYVFRLASASTLLVQLCIAFRKHIQRWFGAVHKTARDDRYLIGEILLNYRAELDS